MVQILPAVQKSPSLGQRLSQGVGRGLEMGSQLYKEHQQKEAVKNLLGEKHSNLPPEFQKLAYEYQLKGENEAAERAGKLAGNQEKQQAMYNQNFDEIKARNPQITDEEAANSAKNLTLSGKTLTPLQRKEPKEKAPPGGLAGIPLTPEEAEKIERIRKENPDATAEELEAAFNKEQVVPGRVSNILESRRNIEKPVYEPTSQKLAAERTSKYIDRVEETGKAADEKLRGLQEGWQLHKQGATGFKLMNYLANYFNNPALADPASKGFNAAMKSEYTGMSDAVKGKVSDFEFKTLKQRIATAEDSPQAAEILLLYSMTNARIAQKERDLLDEKRMTGEIPGANFDIEVRNELRPYADLLLHETNEKVLNILNPTNKNNPNKDRVNEIWR